MLAAFFTVGMWMIGHLSRDLYRLGEQSDTEGVTTLAGILYSFMPDLEVFNRVLEAVHGLPIPLEEVGYAVVYAIGYTTCTLFVATLAFSRKDFK